LASAATTAVGGPVIAVILQLFESVSMAAIGWNKRKWYKKKAFWETRSIKPRN
jgi:hypothetical protein